MICGSQAKRKEVAIWSKQAYDIQQSRVRGRRKAGDPVYQRWQVGGCVGRYLMMTRYERQGARRYELGFDLELGDWEIWLQERGGGVW